MRLELGPETNLWRRVVSSETVGPGQEAIIRESVEDLCAPMKLEVPEAVLENFVLLEAHFDLERWEVLIRISNHSSRHHFFWALVGGRGSSDRRRGEESERPE